VSCGYIHRVQQVDDSSTGPHLRLCLEEVDAQADDMHTAPVTSTKHRVLLITEDPDLIDDVLQLAAAADVEIFASPTATRSQWATSPLVLVGADALAGLVRVPLERRRDVIVILPQEGPGNPARRVGSSPEPWRDSVAIGAEHVIVLPEAARWLGDRLGLVAEGPCRNGAVVGVLGAVGGAGASTLSCAMALAARRSGRSVLLVDHDPLGAGLDLVMGSEELPGARWEDVVGLRGEAGMTGRISAANLDAALPHPHGVALLSHGRRAMRAAASSGTLVNGFDLDPSRSDPTVSGLSAVAAVLEAGIRGYDLVIADLPTIASVPEVDPAHLFLVVPNRIRAIAAAAVVLPVIGAMAVEHHIVLRSSPKAVALRDAERSLAATIIGELADDAKVLSAAESGDLMPDGLVRAATVILERSGLLAEESARPESVRRGSASPESAPPESARAESSRRESVRRESVRRESSRRAHGRSAA